MSRRRWWTVLVAFVLALLVRTALVAPARAAVVGAVSGARTASLSVDCAGNVTSFDGTGFTPGATVSYVDRRTNLSSGGSTDVVAPEGTVHLADASLPVSAGPSDSGYWPGGPFEFAISEQGANGVTVVLSVAGTVPHCGALNP